MRLLEFRHDRISLYPFNDSDIRPYAILSHRWGPSGHEVEYDDVVRGSAKSKSGWRKIEFCAKQAAADKLDFFWVDSCCILKSDLTELSESIISMYRWYQRAAKCYVYLSDVSVPEPGDLNQSPQCWESAFRRSEWFTRGWTLQELIAPKVVEFYSREGNFLGDKCSLGNLIYDITKIPVAILQSGDLSTVSNEEKFRWAASRETTRAEDSAYCLMGIFDVSIPVLYGEEREKAERRLRRAIEDKPMSFPPMPTSPKDSLDMALQQAWIQLRQRLPPQERDCFSHIQAADVRRAIYDLQQEQEAKKSLMNCYRLKDFLEGMSALVKISSLYSDTNTYSAYIWGALKFMFQTSSHYTETFDTLLGAYESIGAKLSYLLANEDLFKLYPRSRRIIAWTYTDLFEFHSRAIRFFRRPGWKQVLKADWADFGIRFEGILTNLRHHKDLAETLARHISTNKSSDIDLHLLQRLNASSQERDRRHIELAIEEAKLADSKYLRVMDWLVSKRPGEGESSQEQIVDHESFCKVRRENPGSSDWLMQEEKLSDWMETEIPREPVLWLTGIPGAGKTILASRVIEECQKRTGFATSFFYCREPDPQKRDNISILKGLLAQMIAQERSLVPYLFAKARSSGQVNLVAHQLTQSLFKTCCERMHHQFLIIDGLDECPQDERRILLSFLAEVVDKIEEEEPGKLRVLIVSQAEVDIAETLSKESRVRQCFSIGEFAIEQKDNKDEIERFVKMWTGRIQEKFGLLDEQADCIKRLMSSRTNGMFLYAKLVLENLWNQEFKEDVVSELDETRFPDGIGAAYEKILGRLEKRWKGTELVWNKITKLLGWMICAKRPLKRYEIQCAFCLDFSGPSPQLRELEENISMVKIREFCSTLVQELPGERLELVHNTARIYLAKIQYVQKPVVECQLATLCLNYLALPFFDPSIDMNEVSEYILQGWLSLQDYAASKWFQHLHALARIYNEEGFKVADSNTALASLGESIEEFLEQFEEEMMHDNIHDGVVKDYAKLEGHVVHDNLTRVMSHVTRTMEKGPESRNNICIPSLKEAFERNRALIEQLSEGLSRNSSQKEALVRYYGPTRFKCSYITCIDFYHGFGSAKQRDNHCNKHSRPWVCENENCATANFGFTSNKELQKHKRDYHPDERDLIELFKLAPKKLIKSKNTCHICGKSFSRNLHKISCIRSHAGERPYACTDCGKTFTRDSDRKRHEQIHNKR